MSSLVGLQNFMNLTLYCFSMEYITLHTKSYFSASYIYLHCSSPYSSLSYQRCIDQWTVLAVLLIAM